MAAFRRRYLEELRVSAKQRRAAVSPAGAASPGAGAPHHSSARRRRQTQGIAGRNASAFAGWGLRRRVAVRAGAGSREGRASKPTSCKGSGRFSEPKRYKRWVLVRRRGRAGNAGGVSTQIAPNLCRLASAAEARSPKPTLSRAMAAFRCQHLEEPRVSAKQQRAGGVAGRGGVARRGSAPPACTPHVPRTPTRTPPASAQPRPVG